MHEKKRETPKRNKKHTHLAGYQQEDKKWKLCRISQRSIRVSTKPLIIPNFFDRKVIETEEVISNNFSKYNNNFLLSF